MIALLWIAAFFLAFNIIMAVKIGLIAQEEALEGDFGLVMISPPNPAVLEREGIRAGTLRKCPSCAETVRMEAKKCRYCAEVLPLIEKKPRSAFARRS